MNSSMAGVRCSRTTPCVPSTSGSPRASSVAACSSLSAQRSPPRCSTQGGGLRSVHHGARFRCRHRRHRCLRCCRRRSRRRTAFTGSLFTAGTALLFLAASSSTLPVACRFGAAHGHLGRSGVRHRLRRCSSRRSMTSCVVVLFSSLNNTRAHSASSSRWWPARCSQRRSAVSRTRSSTARSPLPASRSGCPACVSRCGSHRGSSSSPVSPHSHRCGRVSVNTVPTARRIRRVGITPDQDESDT